MHALHITVEIDEKMTKISVHNFSREDSTELEKGIIDNLEHIIQSILEKSATDSESKFEIIR